MKNSILLVEDEAKTADVLKQALEGEGIDVVLARDGKTAVDEAGKAKFDLVILDLKLPGMSGEEALEGIRKLDPYVVVVVYTNYLEPLVMKRLINLGVEEYINKGPEADLWGLVDRVKKHLDPFSAEERNELLGSAPDGLLQSGDGGGSGV